tara:strand:- start:46 stop:240 length:195 start_codon:yes stop_codon:yes gene_type:complete
MTNEQRNKIDSIIERHKPDDTCILQDITGAGILGLPSKWVLLELQWDSGKVYQYGISPEGRSHT